MNNQELFGLGLEWFDLVRRKQFYFLKKPCPSRELGTKKLLLIWATVVSTALAKAADFFWFPSSRLGHAF